MQFESKAAVRSYIKSRKQMLTRDDVLRKSQSVINQLKNSDIYTNTKDVLLYASYNEEVDTFELMKQCFKDGKNVYLPKVLDKENMEFFKIDSVDDLQSGYMGIMEPGDLSKPCKIKTGLLIMPGLAFDIEFNRVGYGGGFYDRFLEKENEFIKAAIGFDFQVLDSVPCEEHDLKPDYIITENLFLQNGDQEKMEKLELIGIKAKAASRYLAKLDAKKKNEALVVVADALVHNAEFIINENKKDIKIAKANNMKPALLDRLSLNEKRIEGMAEGLRVLKDLEDPIGEVTGMKKRPNGLMVGTKVVPLGVVGIIYESRPNVTADAFGLTFKSGNACILRGGSDSINSNIAIAKVISDALISCNINPDVINLITDTDRALVNELMRMNDYVDVIIPRGGAGLIKNVVMNSTVPVIETGTGNCHVYVDEFADIDMAVSVINNAKTSRIGVCNACESLVINKKIANAAIPLIVDKLKESSVEVRGDELAVSIDSRIIPADEDDWGREYLDYIISVKTVDSIDEAIEHINRYNTGHSESIITKDYNNANKFLDEIDAACVYVNASTRFSDGFEFGFGAEIGISTQKIHARGPMGLKALTTTKFVIYGNGQIRE